MRDGLAFGQSRRLGAAIVGPEGRDCLSAGHLGRCTSQDRAVGGQRVEGGGEATALLTAEKWTRFEKY